MRKINVIILVISAICLPILLTTTGYAAPQLPIKISTNCPLASGQVGIPYSTQLTAVNGIEPMNWYIPDGTLPPGLTYNKTGLISGAPTTAGTFGFSITVYDAQQNKDGPIQCAINIISPATPTPIITIQPFDYSINAVEEEIVLDPNLLRGSGLNRVEALQTIEVRLLSGVTAPGQFYFEGIPEGVGSSCDVMAGSPNFSSNCTFYIDDMNTIPMEGDYPVEVIMFINNIKRVDIFHIRIPLLNDLVITSVKPVQVVYDADLHGVTTLVKGKTTAFKVAVDSSYAEVVNVQFSLNLPAEDWDTSPPSTGRFIQGVPAGWSYPVIWGPISISPGTNEIILPYLQDDETELTFSEALDLPSLVLGRCVGNICGPDVRVMPRPKHSGNITYNVTVDPANTLGEIQTSNNSFTGNANAISTRPWNFYIVPYKDIGGGCFPDQEYLLNGSKKMLEYLLALFPIADSELSYSFAPFTTAPCASDPTRTCVYSDTWEMRKDYPGFQDRGTFLSEISDLAISEGYDFAIGIGCGCGGGASGVSSAFFSGDCSGTSTDVMAHEFNHVVTGMGDIYSLDCLVEWNEVYCEHPDGTRDYYCYEDARTKRDGYTGINCALEGDTIVCDPSAVKNCVASCNCSIYDSNYESYPVCPGLGVCNNACCRSIASSSCSDGTIYSGPDGRIFHQASEGFWVNRYIPVSDNAVYIMDTYYPAVGETIRHWMRLDNTYQHCYEDRVFRDGYLNLLRNTRFLDTDDPEALLISGELGKNGTASFNPFLRITAPRLDLIPGDGQGYSIVLLDGNNNVLESNYFEPVFYQSDPNEGPIDFYHLSYRVQWVEGTKKIELRDGSGSVLTSRDVSPNLPTVKITSPKSGDTHAADTSLVVTWTGSDPDGDPLSYSISISTDKAESWQPIAINLTESNYPLNVSSYPEGAEVLVKVRVTDGVNTGENLIESPILLMSEQKVFEVGKPFQNWILLAIFCITAGIVLVIITIYLVIRKKTVQQ